MSLFKKYISIIQEAITYDNEDRKQILDHYNDSNIFCYLIDEKGDVIIRITKEDAKNKTFLTFLKELGLNNKIDIDIRSKIKNITQIDNIETEISPRLFVFNLSKLNTKALITEILLGGKLGKIIGIFFKDDEADFITDKYKLIIPRLYVIKYKDHILKNYKNEEEKETVISINDKFLIVLRDKLKLSEEEISSIMKETGISEGRARTMNIGYFLSKYPDPFTNYSAKISDDMVLISKKSKKQYDLEDEEDDEMREERDTEINSKIFRDYIERIESIEIKTSKNVINQLFLNLTKFIDYEAIRLKMKIEMKLNYLDLLEASLDNLIDDKPDLDVFNNIKEKIETLREILMDQESEED